VSSTIHTAKPKRIFWLGMHTVLTQTELPRLRLLGFEVYNPPYLSNVEDQSAVLDWAASPTTLPREVHRKLSRANFFYRPIPEEIAEILNEYFDAVIVTINPTWLKYFMDAYQGPIIYRVYGQPYSLSQELANNGAIARISQRDNFWFCPHSAHTLDIEDPWLLDRIRVVPYCLTPDVLSLKDTWEPGAADPVIGLLCPRAADIPYYNNNYKHLGHYFPGNAFRIFGAQLVKLADPRIVGTLERGEFLSRFSKLEGFVYHYTEPTVCYLPPIEFMTIGGPVVFQENSLLARYFSGSGAPGMAKNIDELALFAQRLRCRDQCFIQEIIDSQAPVRRLYDSDYVWPKFDDAFLDMLEGTAAAPAPRFLLSVHADSVVAPVHSDTADSGSVDSSSAQLPVAPPPQETLILFHHFGRVTYKRGTDYHCSEGIARVVRLAAKAMLEAGQTVVVTAFANDLGRVYGFFASAVDSPGNLKILCVDDETWTASHTSAFPPSLRLLDKAMARARRLKNRTPFRQALNAARAFKHGARALKHRAGTLKRRLWPGSRPAQATFQSLVDYVNGRDAMTRVVVPHYYLFPEALTFSGKRVFLYLPDYLPHFYRGCVEMGDRDDWARIGARLCESAEAIFTNSLFTKRYLPATRLAPDAEKIRHIPLPFLNNHQAGTSAGNAFAESLPEFFVFYPTRDRPSKRLRDFVATVALANKKLEESGDPRQIFGVLTTEISNALCPDSSGARPYLKEYCEVSDADLAILYSRAVCLLFTSELEGNFPTQISEALRFETPIVATRMPLIVEELDGLSRKLLLADIGDCDALSSAVLKAMRSRRDVLADQKLVADWVRRQFSYEKFSDGLIDMMGFPS